MSPRISYSVVVAWLRCAFAWAGLSGLGLSGAAIPQPNILLLYVDNVGYGDLGCYGNPHNRTPQIDRLAAEGVRCTDFYVVTSSCTPSRGALLTGRYPRRNGLEHQLSSTENWDGIGLPQRERLLPDYLKSAGYVSGCFGKWNIGFAPGSRPTERGFDEFLGFRSGNIHYYKYLYNGENDLFRGIDSVNREGVYATDLFADAAIDFMQRHRGRPWLVYLPFNAAHFVSGGNLAPGEQVEWQVPSRYLARYGYAPDEPDAQKRFRAVVTALDDAIGRVLQSVDDLQLRERTVVIFISDNGAFMLKNRGLEVQTNAPLRDGGTTAYEGGVRVPAIVRWPGVTPAGTINRTMLSHLDVLPLCLGVAGVPAPADRILDGRDPRAALAGLAGSPHARLAFGFAGSAGLRAGSLKLVRPKPAAPWELYDLAVDVGESRDLAATRPADLSRMVAAYAAWESETTTDASPRAPYRAAPKVKK